MIPLRRGAPVLLLDGGMATALHARGLPVAQLPESWVLDRPHEVAAVHEAHVRAGARLVLTCTFSLARLDLGDATLDAGEVARRAVALARSTSPQLVGGCVGATGLVRGNGAGPDPAELRERFALAFRALAGVGVDLLWAETQVDVREARAAIAAARATGLPVVVTAFLRPGPAGLEALDGTPAGEVLETLWRAGAAAVGVNCVAPDPLLARAIAAASTRVPVPLVVKANAGLPGEPVGPWAFATGVAAAVRAGASLAGGCCGAGAGHLAALSGFLRLPPPQARG